MIEFGLFDLMKAFYNCRRVVCFCKRASTQVTVSTSGAGTIASLATYYVQDAVGVEFNVIAYNGSSEAKAAF